MTTHSMPRSSASIVDAGVLRLIDAYREHVSPRKGWVCASGVAGHGSCSTNIRRAVAEKGALGAIPDAARQFGTCFASARDQGGRPRGFGGFRRAGGFGPGDQFGNQRRSTVQGVCCCGPIPIPFRF